MKRLRIILTIACFCFLVNGKAQINLIPNGSFENLKYKSCNYDNGDMALRWYSPKYSTPDIFSNCEKYPNKNTHNNENLAGNQVACQGENYAGTCLYTYDDRNYREFLQVKLNEGLVKGNKYQLSFSFSLSEKSGLIIDSINFLISDKSYKLQKYFDFIAHSPTGSQKIDFDTKIWQCFKQTFISNGKEKFLTIGAFGALEGIFIIPELSEKELKTNQLNGSCYVYLDNVMLIELNDSLIDCDCMMDKIEYEDGIENKDSLNEIILPKTLYGLKTSKLITDLSSDESFYMDETPVTYEDFKIYVRAGGEKTAYWYYESYNIDEQPVTGISWHHAADYCNWRSKCEGLKPVYFRTDSLDYFGYPIYEKDSTADGYRLPNEEEYKTAAYGYEGKRNFPWGDTFYDSLANIDTDKGMKSTEWWRLAPVKSQFRNSFGLYNLCGNIWHWCDDWQYETSSKKIKGGGWGLPDPVRARIEYESWCVPGNYNYDIGFRCIRNADNVNDSIVSIDTMVQFEFYKTLSSEIKEEVTDFYSEEFINQLELFLFHSYPLFINVHHKIDEQQTLSHRMIAELIIKVCKRNNINPLFLTTIMISESGFGSVSFPRWYNNPMAFHWQNKLMANGEPVYESLPGKKNRKYKTLEDGFEAFCKGIRRDLYYKAAKKNLDAFHLIYVGYRADEWMNTMTRIYRDIAGVRFEPKFPEGDAGKFIYTDWEAIKKNLKN